MSSEPQALTDARRRILLWALPLISLISFGGWWSTLGVRGGFAMNVLTVSLLGGFSALFWLLLVLRKVRAEVCAMVVFVVLDIALLFRIWTLLDQFVADSSLPAFFPIFGFLPVFVVLGFVVMPVRWALANAIVIALGAIATAVPIIVLSASTEFGRFGGRQLLLYITVAMPLLVAAMWGTTRSEFRRRDTLRMAELQQRFDFALAATRDGLWEWADLKGSEQWWSAAMYQLLGFNAGELQPTAETWIELCHPDQRQRLGELMSAEAPPKTAFAIDLQLQTKHDGYRWFALRGSRVGKPEDPVRLAGALQDISGRRASEAELLAANERLAQTEQRFREAFDNAAIGMALVALDGRWLQANQALADIVGYEPEKLVQTSFLEITHPDDLETDLDLVGQLLDNKIQHYRMDKRYLHRDGSIVPVRLSVSLVRDSRNRPLHFVSQIQDISAEVHNAARVKEVVEELRRSNQDLDDFAHTASHDMKAPLRSISGFSKLLGRRLKDKIDTEDQELIDIINRSASSLGELVDELLRYAKLNRGMLNIESVPLAEVAAEAAEQVRLSFPEIEVQIEIVDGLPTVQCDRIRVGQIFRNLMSNSVKYNESSPRIVRVSRHGEVNPSIRVEDNGIGIAEEHRERVFNIFSRLHAAGEYGGGTGAGLTIVKKLVSLHGGWIRVVDSELGGTCIEFSVRPGEPFAEGFDHGVRVKPAD